MDEILAQAQAAARAGGAAGHRSAHRRDPRDGRRAVVQPVAVQPRHRGAAPAGLGVQAVRLPRGVRARRAQRAAPTSPPATVMADEPTTFSFNDQSWEPGNYDGEYDGPVTLRRALALSRNIVAVKVAEAAGYDHVAALWRKVGAGTPPRPYPSIALGVFEATPFEIASAYTIFPNGGTLRPLRALEAPGQRRRDLQGPGPPPKRSPQAVDLPRDEHDAQRDQRGHRRRRARRRVRARRRRQVRHDQRPARRLVRRLHAGVADRRLGRSRRQSAAGAERNAGRAADLDGVHDARPGRPRQPAVRGA